MKTISSLLFLLGLLLSVIWGVGSGVDVLRLAALESQLEQEDYSTVPYQAFSTQSALILAQKELELARKSPSRDNTIHTCQALSHLADAYSRDQTQGLVLAEWARLKASLGEFSCGLQGASVRDVCPEGLSVCDIESIVQVALSTDPLGLDILFEAGWALLLVGEREEGFSHWRKLLGFIRPTPVQREIILSSLTSLEDLALVAPKRFPNLISLLEWYEKSSQTRIAGTFDNLVADAIEDFQSSSEFSEPHTVHWLWRSYSFVQSDFVRQSLDRAAAKYFNLSGHTSRVDYFSHRATLTLLPSLVGVTYRESTPTQSSLTQWGSLSSLSLDGYDRSVGAYLGSESPAVLLELRALPASDSLDIESLTLYRSADNYHWETITPITLKRQTIEDDVQLLSFYLDPLRTNYLKVTYQDGVHGDLFRGPIADMVRVYGKPGGGL